MVMKSYKWTAVAAALYAFILVIPAASQVQSGGGESPAGFAKIYGSFGKASSAQGQLLESVKKQNRTTPKRTAASKKPARAATASKRGTTATKRTAGRSDSTAAKSSTASVSSGEFRPDPSVDTAAVLAESLGSNADEKAVIKLVYEATKVEYEKEAERRGWSNNMAGGLTFFTVAAIMVYHDADEPSDEAVDTYFDQINSAIGGIPEFAALSNRDKQGFNEMLIGFGGILLTSYIDAKQKNDAAALANSRILAGALIQMVLKTDPEALRFENGNIVLN